MPCFRRWTARSIHVECERSPHRGDARRYLVYTARLLAKYGDAPEVFTVVVYGLRAGQVPHPTHFGSVECLRLHPVYLDQMDGGHTWSALKNQAEMGEPLSPNDLVQLVLVPLMQTARRPGRCSARLKGW